ncbi:MAG TPA: MaoC family dehydratase [Aestuariivirgaceae bacterium]|nr:MaoC family dehydratase [Aestuariivirgaceae bacterium]
MTQLARFFEDFTLGQVIRHATPRTLTTGDQALYTALYGSRFALQSSDVFAQAIGYPRGPLDDMLVFNVVFGKTVPDVSLNAVANLGYAGARFIKAVFPGDTLTADSEVIGLKETTSGKTGIVYVSSRGYNQDGETVLEFIRWVMVKKRDEATPAPNLSENGSSVPDLPPEVTPALLGRAVLPLYMHGWEGTMSGSRKRWHHYEVGQCIDHVDGMTVEEAEHMMATRLYQNPARVHFNQHAESTGRFGRRIVYGGHVISLARALSYNGLANAFHVSAINAGRHVAPLFAGGTVYAWSEVVDTAELPNRADIGALRLVTTATVDRACDDFPGREGDEFAKGVILELDYWVLLPR